MAPTRSGDVASRLELANEALDALSAGFLVVGERGRIELANEGAARILGRKRATLKGMELAEFMAPLESLIAQDAEPRRELFARLPEEGTVEIGLSINEFERRSDGARTYVILFQELGQIRAIRREQDRLLQLAAVGEVLPSILHEIRNPLAAITSLLEVFLDEGVDVEDSDIRAILSEVRRMALTLQGIGGLVRSAHADRPFKIDLTIRDACRLLEPMAERKGIKLRAIGGDLPFLELERDVISGLVFNLVKNSIDACAAGDEIRVDAQLGADRALVLVVSDDGPGMSQETVARCREMFFTTNQTGSGIGLALCERITEISGGSLEVESEQGRGTIVTLTIPQKKKKPLSTRNTTTFTQL